MVEIIPKQGRGKPLALMLLVVFLLATYGIFFHPYIVRSGELNSEIKDLYDDLKKFKAVAAEEAKLREYLNEVKMAQQNSQYFLKEKDFNLAAVEIQNRVKELVSAHVAPDENCNVTSQQNVKPRDQEKFERVVVKVRLNCGINSLFKVIYELENGEPMVLLDDFIISKSTRRSSVRNLGEKSQAPNINANFSIIGYLNPS